MYGVNLYLLCLHSKLYGQLQCILKFYFNNFKRKIEYQKKKKKKKATQVSKILGRSEKGKKTSFFVFACLFACCFVLLYFFHKTIGLDNSFQYN